MTPHDETAQQPRGTSARGGHDHAHDLEHVSDARLVWSIVINQILTVAEVAAGWASGSIALLSDAAHNFNDANALLIAYIARRVSRRGANQRYTFGYRRAEMIGGLINLTLLAVVGTYLIYEALQRFWNPEPILSGVMAGAALIALVIDVGTAILLWPMSEGSVNVRAAFLHNLVDALGSVAVLIGAGAIAWGGWTWVDPLLSLLVAGYILWQVARLAPNVLRFLMQGVPLDVSIDEVIAEVEHMAGVEDMHHVHIWELDEHHRALEAHLVVTASSVDEWERIKGEIKRLLHDRFDIEHSTLELESPNGSFEDGHDHAKIPNC